MNTDFGTTPSFVDRLLSVILPRSLHSRLALRIVRALLPLRPMYRPFQRVEFTFFLDIVEQAYTRPAVRVVWTNIFVPSELFWGLGLVPFYPETIAGFAAALGLSGLGVEQSAAQGYPVDLCTFHRSAAGLRAAGLFPRGDAYVATSNLCDVASQMLANFAHASQRPFQLLDVPPVQDAAAVDYLTGQLEQLVASWGRELGVRYDPERMRQAVRLSNQARTLALEVASLRRVQPAPVRGSVMMDQLAVLSSMFGHRAGVHYYQRLRDYVQQRIRRGQPEQTNQRTRLYWMHLQPYYPSPLIAHLEDNLGGVIAYEEPSTVWWQELDEEQPLRALAAKMLQNFFNGPIERRAEVALQHIARYQCAGAIHFSHWGCRQSSGALHVLRAQLRKAGVPLLVLDGDCVDPTNLQLGPLRTRLEAFLEMLR